MLSTFRKRASGLFIVLVMYFTSTFGSLFMLFPYLPILFVNRKLFHVLSDLSLHAWFGLTVFLLEKVGRIRIFMHKPRPKPDTPPQAPFEQSTIVVMNHRTRLDWLFYFCILQRTQALSHIKIILKENLKRVPGPGWAMQTALFIFVRRRWESDRGTLSAFAAYYARIRKRVCILIFPEGTNLTESTRLKSEQYAAAQNLTPLAHLLQPRVTGFAHLFTEMRLLGTLSGVQDVSVAYRGYMPETELDLVKGNLPSEIHFYVEEFNTDAVSGEDGIVTTKRLDDWIVQRWRVKDQLLDKFYKNEPIENYQLASELDPSQTFLYIFPIYWLIASALMLYLIYTFFVFKVYWLVALVTYTYLQFFRDGIDAFIMSARSLDDEKPATSRASVATVDANAEIADTTASTHMADNNNNNDCKKEN